MIVSIVKWICLVLSFVYNAVALLFIVSGFFTIGAFFLFGGIGNIVAFFALKKI